MGLKGSCIKLLLFVVAALAFAAPALAQSGQTTVCPTYDGKYEVDTGWEGAAAPGISVSGGEEQVTVTVAAGYTLTQFCYKTGQGGGGATSAEAPIVGPASFTISKTNSGGGISHVTFDVQTTPPTDECPNIEGNQSEIPAGMVKNAAGECVTPRPPTDECPNIEGNQERIPAGMEKDANGNCVTPAPPVCPSAANAQVTNSSEIMVTGHEAKVTFTVAAGCSDIKLSFVSYKAPGPTFSRETADQQTVFARTTGLFDAGNYTLTIAVPDCYYQVDFVYGDVIEKLGPANSNNFYSDQGRLIRAKNGGTGSCVETDVCPNLEGNQTTLPEGYEMDANGNCHCPEKTVTVIVPGPEREVPGPERIVERTITVTGPERIVERTVEVPGPERIVERRVEVPAAGVAGAQSTPQVVTKTVTKTKVKRVPVVKIKRVVKVKRVIVKVKTKAQATKQAPKPRALPFTK